MAIVPFKWYLHQNGTMWESQDELERRTGLEFSEEDMKKLGRPFYEVELSCTLDTETMKVVILGAR